MTNIEQNIQALDNWLERQNKRANAWNNTKAHLEELKEEILLIVPDINLVNKMFVAGGAIRSLITETKVSDYDIFFKDSDGIQELKEALAYREVLYQSKNSIGLITSTGKHVQFIIITSGSPESVVGEFDFTCNQNYYEFLTKSLTVSTDTYTMNLRINSNARNAMGTFLRIGKFLDKGYTYPPREDMIALGVKMTQQEPITTYEELDESSKMNFKREELNKVQEIIDIGGFDLRVTSVSRVGSNGGI